MLLDLSYYKRSLYVEVCIKIYSNTSLVTTNKVRWTSGRIELSNKLQYIYYSENKPNPKSRSDFKEFIVVTWRKLKHREW